MVINKHKFYSNNNGIIYIKYNSYIENKNVYIKENIDNSKYLISFIKIPKANLFNDTKQIIILKKISDLDFDVIPIFTLTPNETFISPNIKYINEKNLPEPILTSTFIPILTPTNTQNIPIIETTNIYTIPTILNINTPTINIIITPKAQIIEQNNNIEKIKPIIKKQTKLIEKMHITLKITSQTKPLANAQIYLTRLNSGILHYMGETNIDGVFEENFSYDLKYDTFIIYHNCCNIANLQLNNLSKILNKNIDLIISNEYVFAILDYQYKVFKLISGTEIINNNIKENISNSYGFVNIKQQKISNNINLINNKLVNNKLNISNPIIDKINFINAKTKKASYPSLAITEMFFSEQKYQNWQEFKKLFWPLLATSPNLRIIIPSEVERLTTATELTVPDIIKHGWIYSLLKYEFDFLLIYGVNEEQKIFIKIIDKNANIVFQTIYENQKFNLKDMKTIITNIYKQIPFEGSIIEKNNNIYTINLGANTYYMQIDDNIDIFSSVTDQEKIMTTKIIKVYKDTAEFKIIDENVSLKIGTLIKRNNN